MRDLLAAGAGVCQDFAHLALVLLRRHGLAARYVSGYLFAPPEDDESADSAEVETHAWIEALLPAPDGGEPVWVAADPTNRGLTGERHVKIGHGRHYSDVPPVQRRLPRPRQRRPARRGADDAHGRRAAGRPGPRLTARAVYSARPWSCAHPGPPTPPRCST